MQATPVQRVVSRRIISPRAQTCSNVMFHVFKWFVATMFVSFTMFSRTTKSLFFRKENLISFIVNNNLVTHIYINPHCLLHCFFAASKLNWLRWLVASLAYHIIHVCCLSHPKWVKTFIIKCLSIYLTIAPKHKPSLNARTQRISISTVLFSMSVTWYVLNIGLRHNVSVFLFNCIRFVVQLFAIEVDLSPSQCVLWIQDHFLSV